MWFDVNSNLGKITPAGASSVTRASAQFGSTLFMRVPMTAGPDGNLWNGEGAHVGVNPAPA